MEYFSKCSWSCVSQSEWEGDRVTCLKTGPGDTGAAMQQCEQGCVFEQVCCVFDRVTSGWRTRSWARRAGVSRRSWKSCRQSRSGWAALCPNSPSVRRYNLPLSLFLSVCPSPCLRRAEVSSAVSAVWFDCWCVVLSRMFVCNYCCFN